MYSIDTNIFIDWWKRYYPPDVFPAVQKAIETLTAAGKLVACERVHEEIDRVGPGGLKGWANTNKAIFLPHDAQIQAEATQIQATYPDLIDNTTPWDEADRWVIAVAKVKKYIVVTSETSAKLKKKPLRNLYIPDVCDAMGIKCIQMLELMRKEKWRF